MARTTRDALRTALPPLAGLALVALLVHPVAADAGVTALPATGAPVAGQQDATAESGDRGAVRGGSLATSIPVVAFQQTVRVEEGRLRTAVLVTIAAPRGVASIVGQPACRVEATPGVPAWLDCAVGRTVGQVTVRVVLADHRVFTRSVPAVS